MRLILIVDGNFLAAGVGGDVHDVDVYKLVNICVLLLL